MDFDEDFKVSANLYGELSLANTCELTFGKQKRIFWQYTIIPLCFFTCCFYFNWCPRPSISRFWCYCCCFWWWLCRCEAKEKEKTANALSRVNMNVDCTISGIASTALKCVGDPRTGWATGFTVREGPCQEKLKWMRPLLLPPGGNTFCRYLFNVLAWVPEIKWIRKEY